jgi:membrane associated rhomboid family serine protease
MIQISPVVRNLLIINVLVFLLQNTSPLFLDWFAMHPFTSPKFQPHQLLTYMFLHGSFRHLLSNMLGLFFFGPILEQAVFGTKRFIVFYLVTGIGAGLLDAGVNYYELFQVQEVAQLYIKNPSPDGFLQFLHQFAPELKRTAIDFLNNFEGNPTKQSYIDESLNFVNTFYNSYSNSVMLGASGAIFGILGGFAFLFPNQEIGLMFIPIPIKAKYLISCYVLYELYAGVYQRDSGVAHFAHIGGLVFGILLIKLWGYRRQQY